MKICRSCCSSAPCGSIAITITGCNSLSLAGISVSLSLGGSVVASGTTSGQVTALARTAGGSGYTNGTGYALGFSGGGGSGAAGTFNVVSGAVVAPALTANGSGYTSTPTLSFSAAGAGTGANVNATITNRVTLPITTAGSYTYTATDSTGRFATGTHTQSLVCTNTISGITLTPAANYVCWQCSGFTSCAYAIATTLHFSVPGGSGTATYTGSNWSFSPAAFAGVPTCDTGTGPITWSWTLQNGAGQSCLLAVPLHALCGSGSGPGCTWASDAYAGATHASSSGCYNTGTASVTCAGPGSAFSLSIPSYTAYSDVANTVQYWTGPVMITE